MSKSDRGGKSKTGGLGPIKPSYNPDGTPATDSGKNEIDGSPKISPTLPTNNKLKGEPIAGEKERDRRDRPKPRCDIKALFEALLVLVGIATCERVNKMEGGAIVFPSESVPYNFEFNRMVNGDVSDIKKGLAVLSFEGCTVYETMGQKKESWFCFYWTRDEKKLIKEWRWSYCPHGNDGD